jgi:hypothetical protein
MNKPFLVPRSCTFRLGNAPQENRPLASFRGLSAYVLLGDPGAGKTESFKREATESGGEYIRARDFATFGPGEEYKGKVLFIDGLDEMRASGGDGRTPLDHIRKHLDRLGKPPFRLSCREADWLGASDQEALKQVSPNGKIAALHLDPLNDDDIAEILKHKTKAPDAEAFMRQAREHGLEDLLRNPQTLNLLVDAVGGDVWPRSRMQVYAMACEKLVDEINPEHRYAKRDTFIPADALLDAAGYLCAIQLLSSNAGFALDEATADDQHPCWQILPQQSAPLLAALKTKLFQSDGEELRIPVHRSVAEFLGAHYLASQIEHSGLPISRVLALMAGDDGGIVPDLRGLAAWLSVHSRIGRCELIARDPLAVVLYGDVRGFPVADKERVLGAFRGEAERYPWFRSDDWADAPFGALGTKDMEAPIQNILTSQSRAEADQSLLNCVLDAISYGEHMPSLAEPLEAIVRDSSYWPYIRRNGIQALIRSTHPDHSRQLKLAKDIRDGVVEDGEDELIGALLRELYPNDISPSEIFDYLHLPKSKSINSYSMFWPHDLSRQSTDEHLPILLDKLAKMRTPDEEETYSSRFDRMEGAILARGIEVHGDAISDELLYQWLGVILDKYDFSRINEEHSKHISTWFETRPDRYKSLIEFSAQQCINQKDPSKCMWSALQRVSMISPPEDIETWYLDKAATEQQAEIAQFYFEKAIRPLQTFEGGRRGYLPLTELDRLEPWLDTNPKCEPWLLQYISCPIEDQEHALRSIKWDIEQQKKKTELITFYHHHIDAIRDGSAFPQILHDLALAYNGHLTEARGDSPQERLEEFLGKDSELIKATFASFRHTLNRPDLPEVGEIVELAVKGKMHYIRPACLIGMDHLFLLNSDEALSLPDEILSRLLLFRLTDGMGDEPQWFESLAKARPSLVADAFLAYAQPMLRAKKEHIDGLHLMTGENAYAEIARLVLPKLLEGFPVRAGVKQLSFVLDRLLKGGFRYLSREDLATLVVRKSSLKSMDAAQKVYWLTCGLLLKPDVYENQLFQFIGKNQKRRAHLASFIYEGFGSPDFPDGVSIPVSVTGHIIELFGPDCQDTLLSGMVTAAMRTADMMRSFINTLANDPGEQASLEIERLLGLPKLSNWHNQLRHAQHSQRIARRKASFRRLSVSQVTQSIANLQPANAADLAAQTYEQLLDITRKIRDGGTNDYKQYWSYDSSNKRLEKPKPENDCRDALLSDLKERLDKIGIDAQREGNYADDKRADIRVSFAGVNGFNVPIEIKKDTHKKLWRAIHDQLIAKYTRDPGADGYGIYLVFWFGGKGMPLPPDGKKLRSAAELEKRLRQTLSPEESHRISICVIDCSLPLK